MVWIILNSLLVVFYVWLLARYYQLEAEWDTFRASQKKKYHEQGWVYPEELDKPKHNYLMKFLCIFWISLLLVVITRQL